MELINHSECCDGHLADKDLVNMFGGVAYDHDSMPKVVAVHTLTHERMNSVVNHGGGPQFSTVDWMPRKWYSILIGIRSKPQGLWELGSHRSYVDLKEHLESVTRTKASSTFGLEQLNPRTSQFQNTIASSPAMTEVFKKRSPYKSTLKEDHSDSAIECSSSRDKITSVNGQEGFSKIRHLLMTEQVHNNEDNYNCSAAIAKVFPASEKLSSPVDFNGKSTTFSELRKRKSDNLDTLDWRNVGVLAENSDHRSSYELDTDKNSKLFTGKDLKPSAGSNCHHRQASGSSNVGNHFHPEPDKKDRKSCSGTAKFSLEMNPGECDARKRKTDCLIPRKRPRKSIPRKLDLEQNNLCSDFLSTDSEETLSADEITPELSLQRCASVASLVSQDKCTPVNSSRSQCKLVISPGREEQCPPVISTEREEQSTAVVSTEREEQRPPVNSTGREDKCAAAVSPGSKYQSTPVVSPDREDKSLSASEVFPNNMGSDAISSSGTKVVFKRTGGVWSVSSPNSSMEEDNMNEGTCSSGKELGQNRNGSDPVQHFNEFNRETQVKISVFTDRPIACLSGIDEPCFSPALDREVRIKELLSRQEKLLAQMRQKTVES